MLSAILRSSVLSRPLCRFNYLSARPRFWYSAAFNFVGIVLTLLFTVRCFCKWLMADPAPHLFEPTQPAGTHCCRGSHLHSWLLCTSSRIWPSAHM